MAAQEIPTREQHEEHVKDLADLLRQVADIGNEQVPAGASMSIKMDRMNRSLAVAGKMTKCSDAYVAKFGQVCEDMAYEAALTKLYGEGN